MSSSPKVAWAAFGLAVAGAAVSAYLTYYGLAFPAGSCPLTGPFSCSSVLSSPYSKVYGMPVAAFGLLWFVVASWLACGAAQGRAYAAPLLGFSLFGLAGVIGFVFVELFLVGATCLYCTAAHLLGIGILACTLIMWAGERRSGASPS